MADVTISLPEPLKAFIDDQMAAKGYGDVSEYFGSLVREAQERHEEAQLEALLIEGLETGGEDIELNESFWDDLRAEAVEMIQAHKERKPAK